MEQKPNRSTPVLPVYIALGLLVIFVLVFAFEFARSSAGEGGGLEEDAISADSYMDVVTPLLASANAERGVELVERYGCATCHVAGVENRLAPSFEGLADRAVIRRPPMQREAYIYESIIYPGIHKVEGYTAQMPRQYGEQLSEQDLGDIMAYLLTKTRSS